MYKIVQKLKLIKINLIQWNKLHFGNIFNLKRETEEALLDINETIMNKGMDEKIYTQEKKPKIKNGRHPC